MKNRHHHAHRLGLDAEAKAAWWLRLKGYRILAVRLRTPVGEIDVLARRGDVVAIVEVKARARRDDALMSVDPHKCRRLERAADAVRSGMAKVSGLSDASRLTFRFDIVAVAPRTLPHHIANAWQAGL